MRHSLPITFLFILLVASGCSTKTDNQLDQQEEVVNQKQDENKGIGPIKNVTLSETLDQDMIDQGQNIYDSFCVSCHRIEEKFIGPALKGVTERRSPEWILNYLLNTHEMLYKDSIAMKLLEEHDGIAMTPTDMTPEDAPHGIGIPEVF